MSGVSPCPDVSVLQQLALGKLSSAETENLARHCEQCPRCRAVLHSCKVQDTFLTALAARDAAAVAFIERPQSLLSPVPSPAGAQAPDEIGWLGGYRIHKVLGTGGMGVVYQAEDVQLQRPVALKVMKAEVAQKPANRERFLREARAAAKLKSDHVVTIYQVGEERQIAFLAMEFLEGMSLEDWLKKGHQSTLAQAARIGRQVALGLADAHACGLIHRDIKPDNIWLDSRHQGRVKLLDFGLARVHTEEAKLTHAGLILGTPAYMSPEQARGDKVDPRCDLFSLGVVLYQLTTGRLPFRGDSALAILTMLAVYTPPPPSEINSAIPSRLSQLIERLLSKDHEQRPATAKAVADELEIIAREVTTEATSVGAPVALVAPSPAPAHLSGGLLPSETSVGGPTIISQRFSPRRWLKAAALLLLLGTVAAVIIVRIKTPNGNVQEIALPPGTKVEIVEKDEPLPTLSRLGDLDDLDAAKIPEEERIAGLPRETVAVLGSHRGWHREANGESGCFLAYAPDGRRIVTAIGGRGGIHLWDAENLRELGRIALPDKRVTGFAISPDGKSLALATGGASGMVLFWNISGDDPAERPALKNEERIHGLSYSPDGKMLACVVGDKHLVRLWDLTVTPPKVWDELPEAHKDAPPTFAPDGKFLVYGDGRTGLLVWDVSRKEPRKVTVFRTKGGFFRTAFSSDGNTLAAVDNASTVWLLDWDGVELKKRALCPSPEWKGRSISTLVFDPKGKRIAFSCMEHSPRLVDWSGPQLRDIDLDGYETESFNLLAFSPDGKTLATFSCDYSEGNLRVWDVTGPEPQERSGRPGHVNSVRTAAFSRDGKLLASGGERTVRLWRPSNGRFEQQAVLKHPDSIHKLALSHDGKTLAVVGEESLRLWDLSGPEPEKRFESRGEMRAIAFTPDGKVLAWGERADVHLGDLSKRKPVEKPVLKGHQKRVEAVAVSPDGHTLASGGQDNTVRLWNLTQKEPESRVIRLPPPTQPDEHVEALFFLPDRQRLLVKRGRTGKVLDVALTNPQMKWEFTCEGGDLCMTPAPDGRSIFSVGAGTTREMLQRWFSSSNMRPWWVPGTHPCMAVAADGRHLALGNANGTIYVLRMPPPTTAHPPLEDSWVEETSALSLPERIEAVANKLKERNPDFDGPLQYQIEEGAVVEVELISKRIFDLTPLRVLRPRKLNLSDTYSVSDLSPLRGMPLEALHLGLNRSISDFTPLQELPLIELRFDVPFERELLAPLRSIKTLEKINDKPAAAFWK
jgi:WD40 repeat protein/serine/threonine protein kinase